jgi:zinc finger-like protein
MLTAGGVDAVSATPQALEGQKRHGGALDAAQRCEPSTSSRNPLAHNILRVHREIRADLCEVASAVAQLASPGAAPSAADVSGALALADALFLLYSRHSKSEDDVALKALDTKVRNVSHGYELEHDAEERLFRELRAALVAAQGQCGSEGDAVSLAGRLAAARNLSEAVKTTLTLHLDKEEAQLFPLFSEHFDDNEQRQIVDGMRQAMWQTMAPAAPAEHATAAAGGEDGGRQTPASDALRPSDAAPAAPAPAGPSAPADNPVDSIFQMHTAIRADLRLLARLSSEAATAAGQAGEAVPARVASLLKALRARAHFLEGLYRAHSDTEDTIIFPALEKRDVLRAVSHNYSMDHKCEGMLFDGIKDAVKRAEAAFSGAVGGSDGDLAGLTADVAARCAALQASLEKHLSLEEEELWPLFTKHVPRAEQAELIGSIMGQTGADVLLSTIGWIGEADAEQGQQFLDTLRGAAVGSNFDDWLRLLIDTHSPQGKADEGSSDDGQANVLRPTKRQRTSGGDACTKSLCSGGSCRGGVCPSPGAGLTSAACSHAAVDGGVHHAPRRRQSPRPLSPAPGAPEAEGPFRPSWRALFRMKREELESAAARQEDGAGGGAYAQQRLAYLQKNIVGTAWIVESQGNDGDGRQRRNSDGNSDASATNTSGCRHYTRRARLVAPCCDKTVECHMCHDAAPDVDHKMDRRSVELMECSMCGHRGPMGELCSGCGARVANYYCAVCKLLDSSGRNVYHCPLCNVCRVGKGLGIDYEHCMKCNTCVPMGKPHSCRPGTKDDVCVICLEGLFSSTDAVRELPCGHMLHAACFTEYTRHRYSCPVCRKSMGDMTAYFAMIDRLLAAEGRENLPAEVRDTVQKVRCHDCSGIFQAPFHWVYHKCTACGSYNSTVER